MNRGKAEALDVVDAMSERHLIQHTAFDWSWYEGVVTWGGEVIVVYG